MKIAILSGKGGTGKTLVSVNLASVVSDSTYIDCDVEEPNGHLFFKPREIDAKEISVKIPEINHETCDGCRTCVEFCRFNALAFVRGKVKVFNEICHSCGGCKLVCPRKAITEVDKVIGEVQRGVCNDNIVYTGILKIGEVSGEPIIKELLEENKNVEKEVFIDCPPGSACVVMESIKDADYCVLVAEPTTFGLHNLNLVYELVKLFKKPYGVVVNKYIEGEEIVDQYCQEKEIPLLAKIPYEKELGRLNSDGNIVALCDEKYKKIFATIYEKIKEEVAK